MMLNQRRIDVDTKSWRNIVPPVIYSEKQLKDI